ncbi:SDR family oxidoreductase [Muricauda oceani]|uniref:SDR family oxidoreductase n=1 Tax=Flagellimonas oceani TaxID=2698672 RepID=A0A6G7IYS4_9FLAO|nr:SDR family oxidoreductase [Allomuricauda oceani]MBW8244888.1 SDR family oxidoreductase [Allomuricauda oceani]QII43550.1 SDR family oxidoreductase [Allomuricauda oceani]
MRELHNKVALVTGSSRGIGAEIAKELAKAGAKVVVNYAGNMEAAQKVVEIVKTHGGDAIAIQADVSQADQVKQLFDTTIEHYGKMDILVNNAGIMINSLIKDTPSKDFARQMEVNINGVFHTLREAATKLEENGSIINLSTSVNRLMLPSYGPYAATKSAVEQLTRVFAKEVGDRGINVNSISPGPTDTALLMKDKPAAVVERLTSLSPFNKIGKTEDIANVVVFLAGDGAKWISAQNIGINGAMA